MTINHMVAEEIARILEWDLEQVLYNEAAVNKVARYHSAINQLSQLCLSLETSVKWGIILTGENISPATSFVTWTSRRRPKSVLNMTSDIQFALTFSYECGLGDDALIKMEEARNTEESVYRQHFDANKNRHTATIGMTFETFYDTIWLRMWQQWENYTSKKLYEACKSYAQKQSQELQVVRLTVTKFLKQV